MEKDFHFYGTAALARAAGFTAADALTIAYAAQYVDDANEDHNFKLTLGGKHLEFVPHNTSHNITQGAASALVYNEALANPVWIPFHFPPGGEAGHPMVTKKNCPLANLLLEEAMDEKDRHMKLIRLGVAAHTFADSWAHEGFSGRLEKSNDVDCLHCYYRGERKWVPVPLPNMVLRSFIPPAGHAQAVHVPDLPFLHWKCTIGGGETSRDNTRHFWEAAETLYRAFRKARLQYKDYTTEPIRERGRKRDFVGWEELGPRVLALLRGRLPKGFSVLGNTGSPLKRRCKKWKTAFAHWFQSAEKPSYLNGQEIPADNTLFDYDMNACRRAVFGDQVWNKEAWEGEYAVKISQAAFVKSFWACFHVAAKKQFAIVIASLKHKPPHP